MSTIRTFALQQTENRWMMLEFSSLGFIGMLLCCVTINVIVEVWSAYRIIIIAVLIT